MPRLTALLVVASLLWITSPSLAKTDLVTLPDRDSVQLTIYNAADLTLVRDQRSLTLGRGLNRLQFSWAGTLIDPTSLDLLAGARAGEVDIHSLTFPPRTDNLGLWRVHSRFSGDLPMTISYLTSGLSWRAFYLGFLEADASHMRLEGYVRVSNQSGEDYENAQVRLLVGRINLIDRISDLARRKHPYGRPEQAPPPAPLAGRPEAMRSKQAMLEAQMDAEARPKTILKQGLSEYFLYSIEGTETIADGWSKRLLSFEADRVPVVNLYKFEEERFGDKPHRFLSFVNDRGHGLGQTPIPGGVLKVYRRVDGNGRQAYEGQSRFRYVPVGEDVELDLGPAQDVLVSPTLMDFATTRFLFDRKGNVDGWDEVRTVRIEVANTRQVAAQVEVTRNFPTSAWELSPQGEYGRYEKKDLDSVTFTLELDPGEKRSFSYVLTTHHGRRAE